MVARYSKLTPSALLSISKWLLLISEAVAQSKLTSFSLGLAVKYINSIGSGFVPPILFPKENIWLSFYHIGFGNHS